MSKVGVRELKSKTSEILRRVTEGHEEVVITRHGRTLGKIVPVEAAAEVGEGKTLRGARRNLPRLSDEDFAAAKDLWKPRTS